MDTDNTILSKLLLHKLLVTLNRGRMRTLKFELQICAPTVHTSGTFVGRQSTLLIRNDILEVFNQTTPM
eukprot:11736949-Karenia_brevis.AAC.1